MDYDKHIADIQAKIDDIKETNDSLHKTMLESDGLNSIINAAQAAHDLTRDYNVNIRVLDILEKRKAAEQKEVASQN